MKAEHHYFIVEKKETLGKSILARFFLYYKKSKGYKS